MTTCPVCSRPMSTTRADGRRPRSVCSQRCAGIRGAAATHRLDHLVDPAAVWRLTHGDPVTSTRAERLEATALLRAQGRTYVQVADLLRVTPKSIARYISELKGRDAA